MGLQEALAVRIKTMRKSRNMTQADLAKAIGQSPSSITMYETGRREPDFETLEALADVFNVSMESLIGYEPHTQEPSDFYWTEMKTKHMPEMMEIAETFVKLNPEQQNMFMRMIRSVFS